MTRCCSWNLKWLKGSPLRSWKWSRQYFGDSSRGMSLYKRITYQKIMLVIRDTVTIKIKVLNHSVFHLGTGSVSHFRRDRNHCKSCTLMATTRVMHQTLAALLQNIMIQYTLPYQPILNSYYLSHRIRTSQLLMYRLLQPQNKSKERHFAIIMHMAQTYVHVFMNSVGLDRHRSCSSLGLLLESRSPDLRF